MLYQVHDGQLTASPGTTRCGLLAHSIGGLDCHVFKRDNACWKDMVASKLWSKERNCKHQSHFPQCNLKIMPVDQQARSSSSNLVPILSVVNKLKNKLKKGRARHQVARARTFCSHDILQRRLFIKYITAAHRRCCCLCPLSFLHILRLTLAASVRQTKGGLIACDR